MPENPSPQMPQAPSGFQRPGIPGAGNILDPEVRGQLREQIHEAVHGVRDMGSGQGHEVKEPKAAAPEADNPTPAGAPATDSTAPARPEQFRAGPFPHGDVDLRSLPANVLPPDTRPRRGRGNRRFYFLTGTAVEQEATEAPPSGSAPAGPRPG